MLENLNIPYKFRIAAYNGNYITEDNAADVAPAVNGLAAIGLIDNGYFDDSENLGAIPVIIAAVTAAIGVITAINIGKNYYLWAFK